MTTDVVFTLKSPDDLPIVGARITARLSTYIVNGGVVLPSEVLDVTDANGQATMALHPNTGAAAASTYSFEINIPDSVRPVFFRRLTVPDQASITFEELIGGGTGPVIGDLYVLAGYVDDGYVSEEIPTPYVLSDYVASGYVQP